MFTGLIEGLGEVLSLERAASSGRLTLRLPPLLDTLRGGDSLAVNGCCLTLADRSRDGVTFDLLGETLARTNLGALQPGAWVNLERALPADGRLGGHFVQGHIDCPAEILRITTSGSDAFFEVALPLQFAPLVVEKGSVAVDGISLTVASVDAASFGVWIIPHTREVTNLGGRVPHDIVNLEFDLLAKYVRNMVRRDPEPGVT